MRKSAKIITALSVAGLAVAAGSAFTATSGIDYEDVHVGAVEQSITGIDVTAVNYIVDDADKTTGVTFSVAQDLDASFDVVTAKIENAAATVDESTACTFVVETTPVVGTDVTCTFVGVTNTKTLTIVAS